jgi:tRNA modification GTPase
MVLSKDTIAAIATAPGRAAIGVVRVSGPGVPDVVVGLIGRALPARRAVVSPFWDENQNAIDQGLALYFPAPSSYTGEDVLELHGHGGPVVLRLLLERCLVLGARLAEPGEFTLRAFLNGKMDLAQAESVIDLIDAASAHAARSAMRSVLGEFSARVGTLRDAIVELRTLVEATLDFPEEEVDSLGGSEARARLARVTGALEAVLESASQGRILRDGLHIVLAGRPNVGKSSLLNRLAGEDLAIVTDIPGTTRDTIRESIDLEGVPLHVIDTAGLRDVTDPLERAGIERTWAALERADAVVQVFDASEGETAADREIAARLPAGVPRIRVMNKIDLGGQSPRMEESGDMAAAHSADRDSNFRGDAHGQDERFPTVWLSALTGAGVELLRHALLRMAGWHSDPETVFSARERHLVALRGAREHLQRAETETGRLELFAEELRMAQRNLSAITGEFTADDLLGQIFSRFCIGK